jgi:hypothetical protein
MDKITFHPEAIKFIVPKDIPHDLGVKLIHHWIIQKSDDLYAKWKPKPENEQSTEEPATAKQRLYSEFEESKKGSTIWIIKREEDDEESNENKITADDEPKVGLKVAKRQISAK